jgi:hypothetical protein
VDETRSGLPPEARAVIDRVTTGIAEGSYDQIYDEAAEEWRAALTPEQNRATLDQVRTRLGRVSSRTFVSGREQPAGGGRDHTLTVTYNTAFERAGGIETFTLIERRGHWRLARYSVASDALK